MVEVGRQLKVALILQTMFILSVFSGTSSGSVSAADQAMFSNLGVYLPSPQATPSRLLNFPGDKSYGGIVVCDAPVFVLHEQTTHSVSFKAQGTVKVPANKFVLFAPNANYIATPHALDHLPANSFDGVIFRFMAMEDSDEGKGDPALAALSHFTSLRSLDLQKAEITDKGLSQLNKLKELEYLGLFSTEVKGTFLKDILALKKLRVLLLSHDGIDPACLKYLPQFPELVQLNLCRTRLTNAGALPLAQCLNLRVLDISDNPQIDDAVVAVIKPLKKLQHLRMNNTRISDRALIQLAQAGIKAVGTEAYDSAHRSSVSATAARKFADYKKGRSSERSDMETIFGPMSRGRGL